MTPGQALDHFRGKSWGMKPFKVKVIIVSSADSYPEAAKNFIDAYANTNYLRPLKGKEMERFYVNRGFHSELKALMGELEAGAKTSPLNHSKFLFVGHTGCGKSTELYRLANIIETGADRSNFLQENFLPIQYSVSEIVGLYNIEFVDIALSIILGIYREMERLGYVVDDSPARRVYDWLYQTQGSTQPQPAFGKGSTDLSLSLGSLIRLIDVRLKSEGEIREGISSPYPQVRARTDQFDQRSHLRSLLYNQEEHTVNHRRSG